MRKKILFLSFSLLSILAIQAQSLFALTIHDMVSAAVTKAQREKNYGKYTLSSSFWSTTVWLLPYEKEMYEWQFLLTVQKAYDKSIKDNVWLTSLLQVSYNEWLSWYNNNNVWAKERAKNAVLMTIYENFISLWSNEAVIDDNDNIDSGVVYDDETVFTEYSEYETASGKWYTIRKSNNNLYRFNRKSTLGFKTITQLENYLEYQNRIIYIAPNSRRYAIFRMNNRFYFNRDEWSVSVLSWYTINDAKAYIDQHNQPIGWCEFVQGWKCY